ncbi:MAG: DUF86 domain-containing protein [Coriobacteriia bacterium]|nr:DUF86 domain-containing protein [Coriobacteriia bacterium]
MIARREQRLRLWDMQDAAQKILERTIDGRAAFMHDELVQVWVVHHLEIIGEAATHVSQGIRLSHPEVDWIAVTGTRNQLAHGYFDVDLGLIWETVERDVPVLLAQVARILESMSKVELAE